MDGLVYMKKMMPSGKEKNGWDIVLRRPMKNTFKDRSKGKSYNIITPEGSIIVHFSTVMVSKCIVSATNHFLENHTSVRDKDGESGLMTCAGRCVETITSSLSQYHLQSSCYGKNLTSQVLKGAAADLHNFLKITPCSAYLYKSVNELKKRNNVLKSGNNVMHPSYVFSKNLTNSLHIDTGDDSRSFAIFFQQEMNGLTWFLFPFYGIAIECSRHTVISWDRRTMFHYSCIVSDGLYSFFTTDKKDV